MGADSIPLKFIKLAAEPLSQPVTEAKNICIKQNNFLSSGKVAPVISLNKDKSNKYDLSNFRPVSVLSTSSKIYKQVMKEGVVLRTERFLSPKKTAYRKLYPTRYNFPYWKPAGKIWSNFVVASVLINLSRAFDYIPHDPYIAKIAVYGFDFNVLSLICTYLENRKLSVWTSSTHNSFGNIILGVPQMTIVKLILFDLLINDLFYIIENASVFNFADDKTLFVFSKIIEDLLHNFTVGIFKNRQMFKENKIIVSKKIK